MSDAAVGRAFPLRAHISKPSRFMQPTHLPQAEDDPTEDRHIAREIANVCADLNGLILKARERGIEVEYSTYENHILGKRITYPVIMLSAGR